MTSIILQFYAGLLFWFVVIDLASTQLEDAIVEFSCAYATGQPCR